MAESSLLVGGKERPGESERLSGLDRPRELDRPSKLDRPSEPDRWREPTRLAAFASIFEAWRPLERVSWIELAALASIVALGAVLRFWALGSVGLHGDEDTMALATLHIVRHGTPVLPSGMFYPRGIGQLYLMAASVLAFGASEWSLRLPSALCGVLLVPLSYLVGRRFLARPWSLALTATVALLPAFIEDAQTARMYVFLVTSVVAFLALLFEWERTGRSGFLVAAAAVLVLGIQFHQLAVFATFLVLYPGLVRADLRKVALGVLAFAVVAACYILISHWIASFYPDTPPLPPGAPSPADGGALARADVPHLGLPALIAGGCAALALAVWVARAVLDAGAARDARGEHDARAAAVTGTAAATGATAAGASTVVGATAATGALIAVGLVAELLTYDHIAFLALAAGLIIATRRGPTALRRAALILLPAAALLAFQLWRIAAAGVGVRQALGALTGWPSIWPYLAIARYSPVAAAVAAAGVALACWRLARRRSIPDFFLFLALGVWIPLLMIGVFRWSIPIRYAAAESFPLLLGAFAAAQWLCRERVKPALAAAALCLLAANPLSLVGTVYAGYADHPDHQGAARFILSEHPGPRDILVAEDAIEQTYYLGHVDYWLESRRVASDFLREVNGRLEDIYTGAPLIGSGPALERLIARRDRGTIYIIGSGEQQQDGRSVARGPGIQRILHSLSQRVVYVGRDGLTKVWKIPAPASAPSDGRPGGRG